MNLACSDPAHGRHPGGKLVPHNADVHADLIIHGRVASVPSYGGADLALKRRTDRSRLEEAKMPNLDEINEDSFASAVTDEELEAACSTQLTVPTAACVTICCPPSRYASARIAAGLASGACPIRRGPNSAAGRREIDAGAHF